MHLHVVDVALVGIGEDLVGLLDLLELVLGIGAFVLVRMPRLGQSVVGLLDELDVTGAARHAQYGVVVTRLSATRRSQFCI